jgi:hypothetical protein
MSATDEDIKTEGKHAGQPTKYDPKIHLDWARGLSMQGYINEEIADRMQIARTTLYNWCNEYPEFLDALKKGKELPDILAEQALFKKVIGFEYTESKTTVELDSQGKPKPAKIETFKKQFIPDTLAQIFWLKNRRPDRWRDRTEIEVDVKNNDIEKMSRDELKSKLAELEAIRNTGRN